MRNPSAAEFSTKGKTTACCSKIGLKKGQWTPKEDEILSNYIKKEGEGNWRTLPKRAGLLRCGKSCRLRWMNYLRPSIKLGRIAPDEEDLILRLHRLLGNRWSLIAGRIPGRTDNEIKNYYNAHLSKKLISQGIDPRTHKPLDPLSLNQFKLASSSSKPINRKSSPNHQNNGEFKSKSKKNHPNSCNSGVEEASSGTGTPVISNKENAFLDDNNGVNGYISLISCSDEMRTMESSNHVNVDDEDMMNCCSDDVFSSFLNSFINEEPFTTGNLQSCQSFVSDIDAWDCYLLSSTVNPNDHLQSSN